MSCYLFAIKTFNSSFAAVDDMKLELLLDLINVYDKINDTADRSSGKKDKPVYTYKVLD